MLKTMLDQNKSDLKRIKLRSALWISFDALFLHADIKDSDKMGDTPVTPIQPKQLATINAVEIGGVNACLATTCHGSN